MDNLAPKKPLFFYGWLIVGFALISLIITNGATIGGLPVFFKPMLDDLSSLGAIDEVTRPQVTAFGGAVTFYTVAALAFPVGWLIDKINIRAMIAIGVSLLGIALIVYSQAVSPSFIYGAHAMFGLALCMCGSMVNSILVGNWFNRKRGLAMGIMYTGTSVGGIFIPLIATPLISRFGWRTTMIGVSCLIWFVLLPLVALVVKAKPADKGLLPDGETAQIESEKKVAEIGGLTLKEAVKTPVFWTFAAADAAIFWALLVVFQQFILYLQSPAIGMSKEAAAAGLSTMSLCGIGGKFAFGWLSDRLPKRTVFIICCALLFAATLFLLSLSLSNAFLFMVPFGIAGGGLFVCAKLVTIELFGLKEAGKIMGTLTVIETLAAATGLALTGILASRYGGNYSVAFYSIIAVAAVALLSALTINFMQTSYSARPIETTK